jgi:hypothetical protein
MPTTRSAAPSVPPKSNSRAASPLTAIPEDPSGIPADLENPDFPVNPRTSTPVEDQSSPNCYVARRYKCAELNCEVASDYGKISDS